MQFTRNHITALSVDRLRPYIGYRFNNCTFACHAFWLVDTRRVITKLVFRNTSICYLVSFTASQFLAAAMYFINVQLSSVANFSMPFYETRLSMHWIDRPYKLQSVLGKRQFVRCFSARSNLTNFRVLSPGNFTKIGAVELLDLSDCRIEVIEAHTFDRLLQLGIKKLILRDNRLKSSIDESFIHKVLRSPITELQYTVLECDCAFYTWTAALEWNKHSGRWNGMNRTRAAIAMNVTCSENALAVVDASSVAMRCGAATIQTIRPDRICMSSSNATQNYPRFKLKINKFEHELLVDTVTRQSFRIWISNNMALDEYNQKWNIPPKRCPTKGFIRRSMKCYSFANGNQTLRLPFDGINQMCVSYLTRGVKKFWPLHCAVYGVRSTDIDSFPPLIDHRLVILILIGCVIGILVIAATAVVIICDRQRAESQSKDNGENVDDYETIDGAFYY